MRSTVATVLRDTVSIDEEKENVDVATAANCSQLRPESYEEINESIFLAEIKDEYEYGGECECKDGKCGVSCLLRYLNVECGKKCPSGEKCTNRTMQQNTSVPVEVFHTGNEKGFGVRALEPIKKGGFIIEYLGEVMTHEMGEERKKLYAREFPSRRHHYLMNVTDSKNNPFIIDSTKHGNSSRFINHSCEPNADCEKWSVNRRFRMGIFARRNIQAGEEITFGYRFQNYGRDLIKCACGAPSCRRYLSPKNSSRKEDATRSTDDNDGDETVLGVSSETDDADTTARVDRTYHAYRLNPSPSLRMPVGNRRPKRTKSTAAAAADPPSPDRRPPVKKKRPIQRQVQPEAAAGAAEKEKNNDKSKESELEKQPFIREVCKTRVDTAKNLLASLKSLNTGDAFSKMKRKRCKTVKEMVEEIEGPLDRGQNERIVYLMKSKVDNAIEALLLDDNVFETSPLPDVRPPPKKKRPILRQLQPEAAAGAADKEEKKGSGELQKEKKNSGKSASTAAASRPQQQRNKRMALDENLMVIATAEIEKRKDELEAVEMQQEKRKPDEQQQSLENMSILDDAFMDPPLDLPTDDFLDFLPAADTTSHQSTTAADAATIPDTVAAAAAEKYMRLVARLNEANGQKKVVEEREGEAATDTTAAAAAKKKKEEEAAAAAAESIVVSPTASQRIARRRKLFNDDDEVTKMKDDDDDEVMIVKEVTRRERTSPAANVISLNAAEKLQQLQQLLQDDKRDPGEVAREIARLIGVSPLTPRTKQVSKGSEIVYDVSDSDEDGENTNRVMERQEKSPADKLQQLQHLLQDDKRDPKEVASEISALIGVSALTPRTKQVLKGPVIVYDISDSDEDGENTNKV